MRRFRMSVLLSTLAVLAIVVASASTRVQAPVRLTVSALPAPAHIVVVVEENRSAADIIGNTSAPYLNALVGSGALMTQSYAETHPSEPNYLALFAGNTFGLASDACPLNYGAAPNLASALVSAGDTFMGFAEDLPAVGSTTCSVGKYARKHVPWVNFSNVPAANSVPFSAFPPPSGYGSLPTVSFVIPNLDNDMHDGSIAQGDTWLSNNLSGYANWATANNSLLVITWDEDDYSGNNQIPMIIVGAHVRPGAYPETISHYNVLSTIEQMYGLPKSGNVATAPSNCPASNRSSSGSSEPRTARKSTNAPLSNSSVVLTEATRCAR